MSCSFGRYYTEDIFSSILIEHINVENPKTILDLGAGEGSLLKNAIKKWESSSFVAIDINKDGCELLQEKFPYVSVYNQDVLQPDLLDKISLKEEVDIAICNPPYISNKINQYTKEILKNANLEELINLKQLSSDILFLAQNLRVLRIGGELGIILPDTLLTSFNYRLFREILLTKHQIKKIFQLPEKGFLKTEAQTHIIILKKGFKSKQKIPLYNIFNNGTISKPIFVDKNELTKRMDYSYFKWQNKHQKENLLTLANIGADIKRGSLNNTFCKKNNIEIFHTSHFQANKKNIKLKNKIIENKITTIKGDILLARVGKRNIGKVMKVLSGESLISDCVFRIRVDKKYQESVFASLTSTRGQEWLKAYSHGVCAKTINKQDLLNFPLYL